MLESAVEVPLRPSSNVVGVRLVWILKAEIIEKALVQDRFRPDFVKLLPGQLLPNAHPFDPALSQKYCAGLIDSVERRKKECAVEGRSWDLILDRNLEISLSSRSVAAAVELEKERLIFAYMLLEAARGLRRLICEVSSSQFIFTMSR